VAFTTNKSPVGDLVQLKYSLQKQCAAVTTQNLFINVPPHLAVLEIFI